MAGHCAYELSGSIGLQGTIRSLDRSELAFLGPDSCPCAAVAVRSFAYIHSLAPATRPSTVQRDLAPRCDRIHDYSAIKHRRRLSTALLESWTTSSTTREPPASNPSQLRAQLQASVPPSARSLFAGTPCPTRARVRVPPPRAPAEAATSLPRPPFSRAKLNSPARPPSQPWASHHPAFATPIVLALICTPTIRFLWTSLVLYEDDLDYAYVQIRRKYTERSLCRSGRMLQARAAGRGAF